MTGFDVAAARAVCESATPGPWWAEEDSESGVGWDIAQASGPHMIAYAGDKGAVPVEADAEFIAAARTGCECDWESWHEGRPCQNPPMDHGDVRTSPELCGPCLYGCEAERDELAEGNGPWLVSS